jgi:hypothetical protein
MDSGTGGGPDMGHAEKPCCLIFGSEWHPHEQIGKGKISKQLPLGDNPLQVTHRSTGQQGVPGE